ncbi:MAG: NAD(P)(+) transhydrogenase (Re/Si-specific) subunit beta, partial [Candidatus Omnitrophica bacterium]|nr:NAD(P)(+) transhydrogenase (Re/Si-specific) subunit beta [Candidatus Omnitrophota bacterium]
AMTILGVLFVMDPSRYDLFLIILGLSLVFGVFLVVAIGGADMPVVISVLNSYSGVVACTTGFVINNTLLIVVGALVGANGIILSIIMCKAMNRSLGNVIFGGFGAVKKKSGDTVKKDVKPVTVEDAHLILEAAKSVVIVPGYGLAVAQAQHAVNELSKALENNGCDVKFAIHPVAGRMPGHMNVLLAEASIPYDQLMEMEAINPTMETVDVSIIIGANDVVNPAARHDKSSPIYGMPIIDADKAKTVFVLKRSMATGFAGVENELFYFENTRMLFGDAKQTVQALVAEFKSSH